MVLIEEIDSCSRGSNEACDTTAADESILRNDDCSCSNTCLDDGPGVPSNLLRRRQDDEENNKDDYNDEEIKDLGNSCTHCTYAVTGNTPMFQAIFVCYECCNVNQQQGEGITNKNDEPEPLCICQACAEFCHEDHEDRVEYVGMGPCYCDCDQLGDCAILTKSNIEAERLGMYPKSLKQQQQRSMMITSKDRNNEEIETTIDTPYIQDVYQIPALLQHILDLEEDPFPSSNFDANTAHRNTPADTMTLTDLLIDQAHELVKHSKETHWVDESMIRNLLLMDNRSETNDGEGDDTGALCLLEKLAWSIFRRHVQHYNLNVDLDGSTASGGAEWWVQVKPTATSTCSTLRSATNPHPTNHPNREGQDQAIDLHYDKDEAMAESFGIGCFPTQSTVTYLTTGVATTAGPSTERRDNVSGCYNQNPTLVFPHTYDQGEEELMSSMLLSRPVSGKHLVFDGRLLHGAPSHASLLVSRFSETQQRDGTSFDVAQERNEMGKNRIFPVTTGEDDSLSSAPPSIVPNMHSYRITFLVNIWIDHKPANVEPLDATIRIALNGTHKHLDRSTVRLAHHWLLPPVGAEHANQKENLSFLSMISKPISKVTITKEDDLPQQFQERIELPFVCKGITWDEDDYLYSPGLCLTTFPPPVNLDDTLLVYFGPGMQAYLEYLRPADEEAQDSQREAPPVMSPSEQNGVSNYRDFIQDCYV